MEKKSKKKEIGDTSLSKNKVTGELVANCDQLGESTAIIPIEQIDIAKLIVVVRGQQVLIDRDIAMLYKVETKVLSWLLVPWHEDSCRRDLGRCACEVPQTRPSRTNRQRQALRRLLKVLSRRGRGIALGKIIYLLDNQRSINGSDRE